MWTVCGFAQGLQASAQESCCTSPCTLVAMWPYYCHNLHCNKPCYTKEGVIFEHIGYGLKWKIWALPDVPFWGDSKSGGPKLIPFLIRQENTKYLWKAGSLKFDLLWFRWFNLYQDPFFEEIMNLATELLYLAWAMCYTQNHDWGRGGGWVTFPDLFRSTCI